MLKYNGGGFIVGIPARDLSVPEISELERGVYAQMRKANPALPVKMHDHLIASGLYRDARVSKARRPRYEDKAEGGGNTWE